MHRYFVCYLPYTKAYITCDGTSEIADYIYNFLNKDFWTETNWLEYWLYRIFG